jgi:hypothetical protein
MISRSPHEGTDDIPFLHFGEGVSAYVVRDILSRLNSKLQIRGSAEGEIS